MEKRPTVIIGVIGEDPHIIGSKILARVLQKEGFRVVHIGAKCQPREFIEAAIETKAAAILVSSLCGHARLYCRGLRDMCNEAGLTGIKIYVGGNVLMDAAEWRDAEKEFLGMGIDRVYPPWTRPSAVVPDLTKDLGLEPRLELKQ
jgi:methylaspartate mutase sigma subunit